MVKGRTSLGWIFFKDQAFYKGHKIFVNVLLITYLNSQKEVKIEAKIAFYKGHKFFVMSCFYIFKLTKRVKNISKNSLFYS